MQWHRVLFFSLLKDIENFSSKPLYFKTLNTRVSYKDWREVRKFIGNYVSVVDQILISLRFTPIF
jgi:hypothetical protein